MTASIVCTTIYVPKLLENYVSDALASGHQDTHFIVIGDRKTPAEAKEYSLDLARRTGASLEFQDCDDQLAYLQRYPELAEHLPWNSIQRRNIGLLRAYELGCDPIITIDDDNFLLEADFVGLHSLVGRSGSFPSLGSDTGWVDVCQELEEIRGVPFYHRGFPPGERWQPARHSPGERAGKVVVNAGLWLGDPDVDALQRLTYPVEAVRYKRDANFVLAAGSWSPFNSQNTALAREIMPAYFLSPLIGRFDDIWGSYVICRIAEHLQDLIAYGKPVVRQERNPHDYWKDLDMEREPWRVTDRLCRRLRGIDVRGTTYADGFDSVIAGLEDWLSGPDDLNEQEAGLVAGFVAGLGVWRGTIARVA